MKVSPSVIARLKKKDEEAFEIVYYEYIKLIFYTAHNLGIKRRDIEDVAQEIFIRMYNNITSLRENSKFHAWFMLLARNYIITYLTKNSKEKIFLDDEIIFNVKDETSRKDSVLLNKESFLTNMEYEILNLKLTYNFTFKEIAQQLELTMNIVTKTYYKGLDKMKKYYRKEE